MLDRFFTDLWLPNPVAKVVASVARLSRLQALERLSSRVSPEVPSSRVCSFPSLGLRYWIERSRARSAEEMLETFERTGVAFGQRVCNEGLGSASAAYCFDSAALEIFRQARSMGLHCVLEQTIAPRGFARDLLRREYEKFQGLGGGEENPRLTKAEESLIKRERDEWALADLIICGSTFVRDAIAFSSGSAAKCAVVPYGVDAPVAVRPRSTTNGRLKVLFVGELGHRKGIMYLLDAAHRLADKVELCAVGGTAIPIDVLKSRCPSARFVGSVPREQVSKFYEWADIFVLPSIVEGSATAVYEALAHGLPVVCTPNAGSVITEGREGFIVEAGKLDPLVDAIDKLASRPTMIGELSQNARSLGLQYGVGDYGERLLRVLTRAGGSPAT